MAKYRYKLTDENLKTFKNTDWSKGDWKKTSGEGGLCSSGWLHCYKSPLLAVLLNCIHAGFEYPKLLKVEVRGDCKEDNGLKEGWTEMRSVCEIPIPVMSNEQKVRFAILCALQVHKEEAFVEWARKWLNGQHRQEVPKRAICAVYKPWSVQHAQRAARCAICAGTRCGAYEVDTEAYVADLAAHVADAAVNAAHAANRAVTGINLVQLAKKACR